MFRGRWDTLHVWKHQQMRDAEAGIDGAESYVGAMPHRSWEGASPK